jgi:hypothetical protein
MKKLVAVREVRLKRALAALLALALSACGATVPKGQRTESAPEAMQLLQASADAHGWRAFSQMTDVNVSYQGDWYPFVGKVQPILVDSAYRESSQERILISPRITAQAHRGPAGRKQVVRAAPEAKLWYDGVPEADTEKNAAAAAVADAYRMFLLGPFYFLESKAVLELASEDVIDGRRYDRVLATLRPGFGKSAGDRVLIYIDKRDRLVRRLRFTFEALESTRGVVADVDVSRHVEIDGVKWPADFVEYVRRPIAIRAHRWKLTGIDVNRGYSAADISGATLQGGAAQDARAVAR